MINGFLRVLGEEEFERKWEENEKKRKSEEWLRFEGFKAFIFLLKCLGIDFIWQGSILALHNAISHVLGLKDRPFKGQGSTPTIQRAF